MSWDPIALFGLLPVALVLAAGLIRIRLQGRFDRQRRTIDLACAWCAIELDLVAERRRLRIPHWRPLSLSRSPRDGAKSDSDPRSTNTKKVEKSLSWGQLLAALSASKEPLWRFVGGVLRGVEMEPWQAEVAGGLGEPHQTGIALGYYYAAIGMVPALERRVTVAPSWQTGAATAAVSFSVALPIYRLGALLGLLLVRLPWRLWVRVIRRRD